MPSPREPDYYRILQVHPEAEPEVIEAAYHRLVKKYHPDALSPEDRDDPEIQRMVRAINEAYDVLGDPAKRAAYDSGAEIPGAGGPASPQRDSTVERRTIGGRCSKTRQEFEIHLARKRGSDDPFRVVGFTPVEPDEPSGARNPAQALLSRLFQPRALARPRSGFGAPSDEELEEMFDEGSSINFSDILWPLRCPVCSGAVPQPDGANTTWSICGTCSQVSCMGGAQREEGRLVKTCPWCGTRHTLSNITSTGERSKYRTRFSGDQPDRKRLGGARPSLPGGGKKSLPD